MLISDALENLIQTAERSGQSISHNVMSRVYTPAKLLLTLCMTHFGLA